MVKTTDYKIRLHKFCIELIKERIFANLQAIQNAQAAANSEEKSSAGDKYETSRAMNHLEKDMYARQLVANQKELDQILQVKTATIYNCVANGSIVISGQLLFFIAAGLGKISFEGEIVYVLSCNAPVAKSMLNQIAGSKIIFNNNEMVIDYVY